MTVWPVLVNYSHVSPPIKMRVLSKLCVGQRASGVEHHPDRLLWHCVHGFKHCRRVHVSPALGTNLSWSAAGAGGAMSDSGGEDEDDDVIAHRASVIALSGSALPARRTG